MSHILKEQYRHYNRLWFNNKLPKRHVHIRFAKMPRQRLGDYQFTDGHYYIRLNRRTRFWPPVWRATLLHEMGHVATEGFESEEHGPMWLEIMRRLLKNGAFNDLV